MTENTREEHLRSRWSTLSRRKRLALVLTLVLSTAAISLLIALSRKSCNTNEEEDCERTSQEVNEHKRRFFGVVFSVIFLLSGCVIIVSCHKKTRERNSREMAVSYIPDEDLDNSASPTLLIFRRLAMLHRHNCLITSLQFKTYLKFHRNRMRNLGRKILMALMMKMKSLHVMSKLLPCRDCLRVRMT